MVAKKTGRNTDGQSLEDSGQPLPEIAELGH
jgi:hypothetical protein